MALEEKLREGLLKLPFEEALERLEAVVGRMEAGQLPLDDMIAAFEEGNLLSKVCGGKLQAVEKKIEILLKEDERGGEWTEFNPGEDVPAAAPKTRRRPAPPPPSEDNEESLF